MGDRDIQSAMTHIMNFNADRGVWICPDCGREVEIRIEGGLIRTVLVGGDTSVGHSGSLGRIQIPGVNVLEEDDRWISPFLRWLDERMA